MLSRNRSKKELALTLGNIKHNIYCIQRKVQTKKKKQKY